MIFFSLAHVKVISILSRKFPTLVVVIVSLAPTCGCKVFFRSTRLLFGALVATGEESGWRAETAKAFWSSMLLIFEAPSSVWLSWDRLCSSADSLSSWAESKTDWLDSFSRSDHSLLALVSWLVSSSCELNSEAALCSGKLKKVSEQKYGEKEMDKDPRAQLFSPRKLF